MFASYVTWGVDRQTGAIRVAAISMCRTALRTWCKSPRCTEFITGVFHSRMRAAPNVPQPPAALGAGAACAVLAVPRSALWGQAPAAWPSSLLLLHRAASHCGSAVICKGKGRECGRRSSPEIQIKPLHCVCVQLICEIATNCSLTLQLLNSDIQFISLFVLLLQFFFHLKNILLLLKLN